MKVRYLFALFMFVPMVANADMPYRVEQIEMPDMVADSDGDLHRFYVGGAYNFSMWSSGADDTVHVDGENTSSFDVVAGVRATDIFRIEANYIRTSAKWDAFDLTGDTAMLNFILDARIDAMYRLFYNQHLVPYVGVGGGVSWNSVDGTGINHDVSPVVAAMAGFGVELGEWFTLDFGYKYMYMFSPQFEHIADFAPTAHQFRVGARVHF